MPLWVLVLGGLGLLALVFVVVAIRGYPKDGSF